MTRVIDLLMIIVFTWLCTGLLVQESGVWTYMRLHHSNRVEQTHIDQLKKELFYFNRLSEVLKQDDAYVMMLARQHWHYQGKQERKLYFEEE